MGVFLSCTVAALLAGIVVYLLQRRRIAAVSTEAQTITTKLAVATNQIESLIRERAEQASQLTGSREEVRGQSIERERPITQLEQREADLSQSSAWLIETKSQLRLAESRSRSSADLQVVTANFAAGSASECSQAAYLKAANTERQDLSRQLTVPMFGRSRSYDRFAADRLRLVIGCYDPMRLKDIDLRADSLLLLWNSYDEALRVGRTKCGA